MIKKMIIPEYRFFVLLFIISLTLYVFGVLRVTSIFWGDSLYYYAYTRSIVVDQDIDFTNEAFHPQLGFPNPPEISKETGRVTNKFSPGTALFWIPGMLLGQMVSFVGNSFIGREYFLMNGVGVLPQFIVAVSAVFFSILGLWYLYQILKEVFGQKTATLSTLLLFFTTHIFYYTAMDPVNSHSISFLLSAFLLYQLVQVLKKEITWQRVIPMGVTAGFLMLVRNQDVVVVFPVLLALILAKKESILHKLNWVTLYCGSAFLIFSVQIYTTISLFGVLGSPYLLRGETLSWLQPNFWRVLFTLENGLFFFAPILLFSVIMLVKTFLNQIRKRKNNNGTSLPILVFVSLMTFLLQLYVVASWGAEIIGGPYGSRMFISVFPHLSIGIALFISFILQKLQKSQFLLFLVFLTALLFANMVLQTFWMLYRF